MTWNRESNGLFDFDSAQISTQVFRASNSVQVLRSGNHCQVMRMDALSHNGEILALITHIGGDRYNIQEFKGGHKVWLLARSTRGREGGVELSEGDVLRFGKVLMNVKKIGGLKETKETVGNTKTIGKQDTSENNETKIVSDSGQCRICLGETSSSDNPFITPCACDGSLKLIHLLCLREWLRSKLTVRESGAVLCYSWQSLSCELCKEPLPETVRCGTGTVDLIDFHQADLAYIILEDFRSSEKTLYVVSLYPADSIRIGRGHESEIRISDISVSRLHATIKFVDGRFLLEDRRSKFGTLVQSGAVVVSRSNFAAVQVGRTVLELSVVRDLSRLFRCCLCCIRRGANQVAPERHPAETFTDNERDLPAEDDRPESAEAAPSGEDLPATVRQA